MTARGYPNFYVIYFPTAPDYLLSFFLLIRFHNLLLDLGLDDILEGDGISGELGDTLSELLNSHLVLVEVEAESGLVVDVSLLLKVEGSGAGSVELLGDGSVGVEELLKEVGLFIIGLVIGKWST